MNLKTSEFFFFCQCSLVEHGTSLQRFTILSIPFQNFFKEKKCSPFNDERRKGQCHLIFSLISHCTGVCEIQSYKEKLVYDLARELQEFMLKLNFA